MEENELSYSHGTYLGVLRYKSVDTDVKLLEEGMELNQSVYTFKKTSPVTTRIAYRDITDVSISGKYGIADILVAILAILVAVLSGQWIYCLIVAGLCLFTGIGKKVVISYGGASFEIPMSFGSQAEGLKNLILTKKNK